VTFNGILPLDVDTKEGGATVYQKHKFQQARNGKYWS